MHGSGLGGLGFNGSGANRCATSHASRCTATAYDRIFQFPVGPKGLQISPTLREAQGKRVAIQGYVVQQEVAVPGKFLLTPRPVQMSQHADGEADDLPPATLLVSLPADQQDWMVAYTRGLVEVVGVLDVGREEGKDGRVTWVRLQLDSEATKRMNAAQFFSYRHAMQHKH